MQSQLSYGREQIQRLHAPVGRADEAVRDQVDGSGGPAELGDSKVLRSDQSPYCATLGENR